MIEGLRLADIKADNSRRAHLEGKRVRIWSCEHELYWRQNGAGYTPDGLYAGIFEFQDAYNRTCHCGPEKGIEYRIVVEPCGLCHGTGKVVPGYVTLSDPCPCKIKCNQT